MPPGLALSRVPVLGETPEHSRAPRVRSGMRQTRRAPRASCHAPDAMRSACAPACAHALRVRSHALRVRSHAPRRILDCRAPAREGSQSHPKRLTRGARYGRNHMGVQRAYGSARCLSGEFRYADAQDARGATDNRSRVTDSRNPAIRTSRPIVGIGRIGRGGLQ